MDNNVPPGDRPSSPAAANDDAMAALIDALATVSPTDRKAIAAHVMALMALTPAKRAAILTLTT